MTDEALKMMLKAHRNQTMPDDDTLPYAYHCLKVREKSLNLLMDWWSLGAKIYNNINWGDEYTNLYLIVQTVALLHDTLEDTDLTYEEIEDSFGGKVANCVKALSRNYAKNFDEYLENIKNAGVVAIIVKTADRIVNLSSYRKDWSIEKCKAYAKQSYKIYNMVKTFDENLANLLLNKIKLYEKYGE